MSWSMPIALGLAPCPAAPVPAPPAKPKAKAEFRWLEDRPVKGLTEDKGFQASCDPNSLVYPHQKPSLVLTAAEVAETTLTENDFTKNGLAVYYSVTLHLTKESRAKLAASAGNDSMSLTIMDGRNWGVYLYEKGGNAPEQARSESFTPSVGFFSTKAEAERLVDALK